VHLIMADPFDRCPKILRSGSQPGAPRYRRVDRQFAIHGSPMAEWKLQVLSRFEGNEILIARGEPPALGMSDAPPTIGPVYALHPAGGPAVPTGRVLVRFAEGVMAQDREASLRAAGYTIDTVLPYAPQAAFVTAVDADICSALLGITRLEPLADVVHVEPEMLSEAARRD
jgi:hypothetical protein